jgi:hypothetical protein
MVAEEAVEVPAAQVEMAVVVAEMAVVAQVTEAKAVRAVMAVKSASRARAARARRAGKPPIGMDATATAMAMTDFVRTGSNPGATIDPTRCESLSRPPDGIRSPDKKDRRFRKQRQRI